MAEPDVKTPVDLDSARSEFMGLLAPYKTVAIAKATGVTVFSVRLWKRGDVAPTHVTIISQLAAFLGLESGYLLDLLARVQASIEAKRGEGARRAS